jgi:predicted NBD/HSP70 family sugar kinase
VPLDNDRGGQPAARRTDQQHIRRQNLSRLLGVLAFEGPMSRAGLAERLGLTKATVSTLVHQLEDHGYVADAGFHDAGRRGRPATLVALTEHHVGVGLTVDADHVAGCATDLGGQVVAHRRLTVDNTTSRPRVVVNRLVRLARSLLDELASDGRAWRGVTVAVPGLIEPTTGLVVAAPNLGWEAVPLGEELRTALGGTGKGAGRDSGSEVAVVVDNEADLVATAEISHGWGRTFDDFLVLSTGIGVGGGVVSDGRVFRGAHGFGGELGHFVIDPLGPRCVCGNRGCLERYVGRGSLPGSLGARDRPDWAEAAASAAARGDSRVLAALDEVAARLGRALVSAVHLFDPQAVVLAGDLAPVAPWLSDALTADLTANVLGARWARYSVVASTLGADAALLGASTRECIAVVDDPVPGAGGSDAGTVTPGSRRRREPPSR